MTAAVPAVDVHLLRDVLAGRRGLPSEAFVDEDWFAAEVSTLVAPQWMCIALADDVREVGDLHPVTLAGIPLLVARGKDGAVRVFHNVCSHRGATLVDEPVCGASRITCPYHQWMYGLDGALEHTPHAGGFRVHTAPEIDQNEHSLRSVRSEVWNGFVFVDLSGKAVPFEDHIAPTAERLAPVDFSLFRHDRDLDQAYTLRSNWKTIVENFVESYHVPQVHPDLQKFNPMSAHFQILGGAHYAGQGGTAYGASDNPEPMPGEDLPKMQGLVEQSWSYESLYAFPNFIIAPIENMTFVLFAFPQSAGVTDERLVFFFYGDESMTEAHRAGRAHVADAIVQVNLEDIGIVEACQRGRRSPAFTGGVFLPQQERTSLQVQQAIAGRMLEQLGEPVDFSHLVWEDVFHANA
ncbi:MAG: aromatic ring-hydroxylating oxygenase subunit alpha [Ilumatobacteraceae bacterium]